MIRILSIFSLLVLLMSTSACRMSYILHAAAGQFRLLNDSIAVEEALKEDSLNPEERSRLRLVAQVKAFGENALGLKQTQNYQTVYLKSRQPPIYVVAAAPKDRLTMKTWWFPVVGRMPYLGFFNKESARAEKEKLQEKDLDVIMTVADAYSTLGWFQDPVTLNLLEGSTLDLVETILHEMTHTTLYVKGNAEFNEGLAGLVGKVGAIQFLEKAYGPSDAMTIEAKKNLEDERLFSPFLSALMQSLEQLYNSPVSYQEKLTQREKVFARGLSKFAQLKAQFKTNRFAHFENVALNNAYILSIGLYHRHFHLFEAVLKENGNSLQKTILFFRQLTKEEGDIFEKMREKARSYQSVAPIGLSIRPKSQSQGAEAQHDFVGLNVLLGAFSVFQSVLNDRNEKPRDTIPINNIKKKKINAQQNRRGHKGSGAKDRESPYQG